MAKTFGAESGPQAQALQSSTGMQTFVGTPASRPAAAGARLNRPRSMNYLLAYLPLRWMFIRATGEWLPELVPVPLSPGVGLVDKNGDYRAAKAQIITKGGVVIDPSHCPPYGYIQAIPAQGGDYHCTIWETPRMIGATMRESIVDSAGYYEWLRGLIRKGLIPQPDPVILEELISRVNHKLETMRSRADNPVVAKLLAEEEAYLATMGEMNCEGNIPSRPGVPDASAEIARLTARLAQMEALLTAQAEAPAAKPAKAPKAAPTEPTS